MMAATHGEPQNVSVTSILRLTSPQARGVLGMFINVDLALAVANLGAVRSPWPTLLAWLVVSLAAVVITLPAAEPLPWPRVAGVLAAVAVSTALVEWNLRPVASHSYETWHLGANTLVLLFVGLRGRSGPAWIGFTIMVGITVLWSGTAGAGTTSLLALLPNQIGTLLVGTLFAIGLRRTSARITALHAEQAALASTESAMRAAEAERARQAARLNAIARPSLERIAGHGEYTDAERDSWIRLEASIRDSLRAPALDSETLAAAADDARRRGIEVTLLDDSGGALASPVDRETVSAAIIRQLATMRSGRLIGRVLPRGRGTLATILVDDGESTTRTDVDQAQS